MKNNNLIVKYAGSQKKLKPNQIIDFFFLHEQVKQVD